MKEVEIKKIWEISPNNMAWFVKTADKNGYGFVSVREFLESKGIKISYKNFLKCFPNLVK